MRLLTNSRYGTRMIIDIAMHDKNGPVQMSDISKRQNISQKYLEKIIRDLKKAGFIKSVRGPKGGHMLAVPADKITIGDIVRVLEGDSSLVDCNKDENSCSDAPGCLTRIIWKEGEKAMFAAFDALTVGELVHYAEHGVKFGDTCDTMSAEIGKMFPQSPEEEAQA